MMRYWVQPRDQIFVKGYWFLCFSKNMANNIGKKKRVPKRVIQKIVEATGDLIDNEIANRITKVSKNSETITNENDQEITTERSISPEER